MPELPEVERGRRQAECTLVGRQIVRVAAADDRIVFNGVTPRKFAAALKGRNVVAAHRTGKQMWFELDQPPHPLLHFGMTGRFHIYKDGDPHPRFWKVVFTTDAGDCLCMTNMRRLGRIRLQDDPPNEPPISQLGADPLNDLPPASELVTQLARRRSPIKALLLNQSLFAGVGNWIADEVLYQAKIAPHRLASNLSPCEVGMLRKKLSAVIRKAVEVDADKHKFPRTWLFHHRWGKVRGAVTSRGEAIAHTTIGGRTTAWVPAVQK